MTPCFLELRPKLTEHKHRYDIHGRSYLQNAGSQNDLCTIVANRYHSVFRKTLPRLGRGFKSRLCGPLQDCNYEVHQSVHGKWNEKISLFWYKMFEIDVYETSPQVHGKSAFTKITIHQLQKTCTKMNLFSPFYSKGREVGDMIQQVELPLVTPASHTSTRLSPGCSTSMWIPANNPRNAMEYGPST